MRATLGRLKTEEEVDAMFPPSGQMSLHDFKRLMLNEEMGEEVSRKLTQLPRRPTKLAPLTDDELDVLGLDDVAKENARRSTVGVKKGSLDA